MPAYGFFIRHVKDIALNNVEVSYLGRETRAAFILDDVNGASLFNVKARQGSNAKLFQLKNVRQVNFEKVQGVKTQTVGKSAGMSF